MSQYQRMISYLYRYEGDVKGNNTGYARIELRGDSCRITVQMRDSLSDLPEVAFFRQESQGMQQISAGRLKRNGNGFKCRIETRVDNMMNSGYSFADMDGLIIIVNNYVYYATTWKDITVHLDYEESMEDRLEAAGGESRMEDGQEAFRPESEVGHVPEENMPEYGSIAEQGSMTGDGDVPEGEDIRAGQDVRASSISEENLQEGESAQSVPLMGTKPPSSAERKTTDNIAACQCEACCRCPQRRRMEDFGHHMLAMFPKMYPFEIDSIEECVRLELKDIGCLPVRYWSLSGNPFLLHGYYCYRHILFTKVSGGEYYIGVPGIYNQENDMRAKCCGFGEFKTLSEVADRQGAFGYWLFGVSD